MATAVETKINGIQGLFNIMILTRPAEMMFAPESLPEARKEPFTGDFLGIFSHNIFATKQHY